MCSQFVISNIFWRIERKLNKKIQHFNNTNFFYIYNKTRKFLPDNQWIYICICNNDNNEILYFQKLDTTIRFFNRSDYYTLHGSDALFAAQEVFKTTSVCKMIGAGKYFKNRASKKRILAWIIYYIFFKRIYSDFFRVTLAADISYETKILIFYWILLD